MTDDFFASASTNGHEETRMGMQRVAFAAVLWNSVGEYSPRRSPANQRPRGLSDSTCLGNTQEAKPIFLFELPATGDTLQPEKSVFWHIPCKRRREMQKQRKLLRIAAAFVAVLAVTAFQATALADVIFDNTGDVVGGSITTNGTQLGDQVTAAGTARTVTEVDLGFTDTGTPTTADLQAFLYANDDGRLRPPGTLFVVQPPWKPASASIRPTFLLHSTSRRSLYPIRLP